MPLFWRCFEGFLYIIHPRWCRISYKSTGILTDLLRTETWPKDIVLKVWFRLLHHTLTTLLDPEMWCSSYKTLFPYWTTMTPMNVEHSLQKHHFPLPSPKFDKDVSLNHCPSPNLSQPLCPPPCWIGCGPGFKWATFSRGKVRNPRCQTCLESG